jgi:hypothetical protein
MIGAGNGNFAGFKRLTERVECLRLEFRNYVAVSARAAFDLAGDGGDHGDFEQFRH